MKIPGYIRVVRVYPVWLLASLVLLILMVKLELHYPNLILLAVVIFLAKDLLVDTKLIKVTHPRVYWAEHAPIVLLISIVGILGLRVEPLEGYVTLPTILLASVDFILNLLKDLKESPEVYSKKFNA